MDELGLGYLHGAKKSLFCQIGIIGSSKDAPRFLQVLQDCSWLINHSAQNILKITAPANKWVFPKIGVENPPNHPFVHRVGTIIFTIHFGGQIPLFLGWHPNHFFPFKLGEIFQHPKTKSMHTAREWHQQSARHPSHCPQMPHLRPDTSYVDGKIFT